MPKEPAQGRKVLVKQKGSTMKALRAISNCVLTNQRKMQQDKAAAKPPKTNQHEGKLLQSGWVQVKSLRKALQQNHPFCAQIGIENSG